MERHCFKRPAKKFRIRGFGGGGNGVGFWWGVLLALALMASCTQNPVVNTRKLLTPRDFLKMPSLISSSVEYGHIGQFVASVPATSSIFLAGAGYGTFIEYQGNRDSALHNSPVQILDGVIRGGEVLDIFATGTIRHIPRQSVQANPNGWDMVIVAGPIREIDQVQGRICSLVGLFDNQSQPFIIGNQKQVHVPRGARSLYLGVLDYPGASSDNEGEFEVSIDVIRR